MSASPSPETLLRISAASFRRQRLTILDAVDLTLRREEIVTLIGPNGAGKSTLLKIALGLLAPDTGEVWRAPGVRIGYVPQKLDINQALPLTVRRFITLSAATSTSEVENVLTDTGIPFLIDASVHTLSGGEWQRVLLARALLHKPTLLFLDEPAQGLDISGQDAIYALIRRIRDTTGCGILLVSHDLHLVMASSNRVLCMNRHICCSGRPEEIRHDPAYQSLFGGVNVQHLALYQHHHDHEHPLCDHEHHHHPSQSPRP
ncbi:MAG: metal ABC transporter ATP-binding protein [Proteobacteria bacterium]|nr:metal ABC transporter ATP-binding protein [Pseudomonadota bacterium]MCL2308175.1 metal ABC transporter ATP-binding protein [Pseudomonadota bacterium]